MPYPYPYEDPLRSLAPIPEHPSTEASDLTEISKGDLASLQVTLLLEHFGRRSVKHNRAASILASFYQFLEGEGQDTLRTEICLYIKHEERISQLADHLLYAIIVPFKASGGKQHDGISEPLIIKRLVTEHLSEDAADKIKDSMSLLDSAQQVQRELRKICHRRDGYCCVYSGFLDYGVAKSRLKDHAATTQAAHKITHTEACHILPFALGSFNEKSAVEIMNKATIWWAVYHYFPALKGKIGSSTINQPENVITLTVETHSLFGYNELRFQPTEIPNVYDTSIPFEDMLGLRFGVSSKSSNSRIQLEQNDATVPMPDPEYLKLHYIISQILDVSGLGDEIEKLMGKPDTDDDPIAWDGSTDLGSIICRKMLILA